MSGFKSKTTIYGSFGAVPFAQVVNERSEADSNIYNERILFFKALAQLNKWQYQTYIWTCFVHPILFFFCTLGHLHQLVI
jgi:hypothetical protein